MTAPMNSRSGGRVPAGVSGQAGRGTVGTDAPTAQKRRRFRDAIVQDIDASHPNALSRLDRLDGVGLSLEHAEATIREAAHQFGFDDVAEYEDWSRLEGSRRATLLLRSPELLREVGDGQPEVSDGFSRLLRGIIAGRVLGLLRACCRRFGVALRVGVAHDGSPSIGASDVLPTVASDLIVGDSSAADAAPSATASGEFAGGAR